MRRLCFHVGQRYFQTSEQNAIKLYFLKVQTQTYPVTLVFSSLVLFVSCQLMSCLRMDLNKATRSLLVWRHEESCNDTEEIAVATNTTIPTTIAHEKQKKNYFVSFLLHFFSSRKKQSNFYPEFDWHHIINRPLLYSAWSGHSAAALLYVQVFILLLHLGILSWIKWVLSVSTSGVCWLYGKWSVGTTYYFLLVGVLALCW